MQRIASNHEHNYFFDDFCGFCHHFSSAKQSEALVKSSENTEKLIGRFPLGMIYVDLIVFKSHSDCLGSYDTANQNTGRSEIRINLLDTWEGCFSTLLHESMEQTFALRGDSFQPDKFEINKSPCITRAFMFDHTEFASVMEIAGRFCSAAYGTLLVEWNRAHRERKVKKTK